MTSLVSLDMQQMSAGSSCWADGQLQSVGVKAEFGTGRLSTVRSFQSGISIVMQDFSLHGTGKIRLHSNESPPPLMAFFTSVSGVTNVSYSEPRVSLGDRFSNIELPEYQTGQFMDVKSNSPVKTLMVCMDADVYSRLTGQSSEELADALYSLDRGKNLPRKRTTRSKNIDFSQQICAHQIYESFTNNPSDKLFLEAKALELVALQLKQLEHLTGESSRKQVTTRNIAMVSRACDILANEMANPPAARELARRVGLNHNQLVRGFQETLGVAPFEYLRVMRLEKARHLIASRECNVTEAAFTVGYSSLSHFCKTFRDEFGVNPKTLA